MNKECYTYVPKDLNCSVLFLIIYFREIQEKISR